MRRFLLRASVVVLAGCFFAQGAHSYWQSRAQISVGAAAYVGPGDVVAGATYWYGLRAYAAATSGTIAVVCDAATGLTCANVTVSAGVVSFPLIGGLNCNGGVACVVSEVKDQIGTDHVVQADNAKRPALSFACTGLTAGRPCMVASGTANGLFVTGATAIVLPWSASAFAKRTADFTTTQMVIAGRNAALNNLGLGFATSADLAKLEYTAPMTRAALDGAWHALQGTSTLTTQILYVDGGNTSAADTGADFPATPQIAFGNDIFSNQGMSGEFTEAGFWSNKTFSGTEAGNLRTNQCTYWGASC